MSADPALGPRLIACDLDGTLLRSDGTVSQRTRSALALVQRRGVTVVLVTGRPPRWMPDVAALTGHRGVAICANGAVVYDLAARRVLGVHPLALDSARRFTAELRAALPDVAFAVEAADGGFGREAHYPGRQPPPGSRIAAVASLLDRPAVKLLARHRVLSADELLAAALACPTSATLSPTHSNSADRLVEIAAAGVTKASALAAFADRLGLAAQHVWAFGDMPNDLPMLRWAGRGVAVAGAHPAALAAADEVAPGNDEDGVAVVLERMLAAVADADRGG